MSERHRSISGTPERSAEEATNVVVEMLAATLEPATALNDEITKSELGQARSAVRMLIAGKHLGQTPMVLVADPLRLEITVVSGDKALSLKENLGKVPGAASATNWTLHLPAPAPISSWITEALEGLEHVSSEPATTLSTASKTAQLGKLEIDPDALSRVGGAR